MIMLRVIIIIKNNNFKKYVNFIMLSHNYYIFRCLVFILLGSFLQTIYTDKSLLITNILTSS